MTKTIRFGLSAFAAALTSFCLMASAAQAATITVGTTADTSTTACTLRNAISAANNNAASGACTAGSGSDTIDLTSQSGTITLGTPLPDVADAVAINGPGSGALSVSGNDAVRVFAFDNGTSSISGLTISHGSCGEGCGIDNSTTLDLSDVTLTHNVAASNPGQMNGFPAGGAISNQMTGVLTITRSTISQNAARAAGDTFQNSPSGGGIFNAGTLTLDRTTVAGNDATAVGVGGASSATANGGAIVNDKNLTIRRSTLSANTASATGGGSNSAGGGAVLNGSNPSVNVIVDRSTITGNTAVTGAPSAANSATGGITFGTMNTATVKSSTITGNSAAHSANIVLLAGITIKNTIVSNPLGGGENCGGTGASTSQGFNLTDGDGNGCGFIQPTDQLHANPMLDPNGLADNGGPTKTITLLNGSPAIDKGQVYAGEADDQRGRVRPFDFTGVANATGGGGTDIGAFEVQAPPTTSVTSGPADGAVTADSTPTFELASTEPNSTFRCAVDDGPIGVCPTPFTPAALDDGQHSIAFIAVDASGNPGAGVTRTFSVDATAPETKLTTVPRKTIKTKSKRKKVSIAFSSEVAATYECSLDGAAFSACTSPTTYDLKKGAHVIEVRSVDAVGNIDATPARAAVKIKLKKPKKHPHLHHHSHH
jgi:hypothetical protein